MVWCKTEKNGVESMELLFTLNLPFFYLQRLYRTKAASVRFADVVQCRTDVERYSSKQFDVVLSNDPLTFQNFDDSI